MSIRIEEEFSSLRVRKQKVLREIIEILDEMERDYEAPIVEEAIKEVTDEFNAALNVTGAVAASFTSTAMLPRIIHEAALTCKDEIKSEGVEKRGYVKLITNFGSLHFELFCDVASKACDSFIRHCNDGYYNGTKFHRSLRNFLIQGGDPTCTSLVGESVSKKPPEDEIRSNLNHSYRGLLSMANSGSDTNGSQFFITFRSCKQLDGKHMVFGKIVGGMETLNAMEQIEVDNDYRPIYNIIIKRACVFVDPFKQAEEKLATERAAVLKRKAEDDVFSAKPKKYCV